MAGKFIGSCRRFIYAQAQCFFISCCLSGSANGMYVKTRLQKADPQFIYAQAQCFFVPRLSSYDISREAVFFSPFLGDYARARNKQDLHMVPNPRTPNFNVDLL